MTKRVSRSRTFLSITLASQLAFSGPALAGDTAPSRTPDDDATIAHVLNRLTFGATPTEIARVRGTGLQAWIEAQLGPAQGEDKALTARLALLPSLALTTSELREKYEIPPNLRQEVQKARAEREEAAEKARAKGGENPSLEAMASPMERRAEREDMIKRFPELSKLAGSPAQVISDLQAGKVLRAVYAERQLEEVMVDFWFNHFNVFARKGPVEFMVNEYERSLRKNALGKFEDLLVSTARSPAMLFYLDNWQSTDPDFSPRAGQRARNRRSRNRPSPPAEGMGQPEGGQPAMTSAPPRRTFGINENYARELMELHTLGVDGGYTQADVIEVAKAFTGWTILGEGPGGPRRNKETHFSFEEARHVKGDKKVLGVTIRNGGEKEGLQILHLLATRPATATFIATKLIRRFVSDTPPATLVRKAAATFEKTGGDIREVVRTIVTSDEFLGPDFRKAKIKTPFEFVVSAARASGADVRNARDLAQHIGAMGMPLYLQQPPTGYKDTAEEWISTSALLERMNFALDLAAGRIRGVRLADSAAADSSLDAVAEKILPGGLSQASKKTLEAEAEKDRGEARLVGLVLGSPEFQRR